MTLKIQFILIFALGLLLQTLLTLSILIYKPDINILILSSIQSTSFILILSLSFLFIKKKLNNKFNLIKDELNSFFDFVMLKKNTFEPLIYSYDDEVKYILDYIKDQGKIYDLRFKEDLKIMGEIVLINDKIEQGTYTFRINSKSNSPMIETLRKTMNKMLDQLEKSFKNINFILKSFEVDDYTGKITIENFIKDDMRSLMGSINLLGDSLIKSAKTNLKNGTVLEDKSSDMNQSMKRLAYKANEQATSLEETAAALEEITSIIRNNTGSSVKMAKLGENVKVDLNKGNILAQQTNDSMEDINKKVDAINNAIGIIEKIAFQTNILSLNAAVEAATAGESGKGFAVVAGEVRNLANRSAEAAKEIKQLVLEAKKTASDGKDICKIMIDGYDTLNDNIIETIDIIRDVSEASKEQMIGIEQINDSMNLMDNLTQENANEANLLLTISNDIKVIAEDLVLDAKSKKFNK